MKNMIRIVLIAFLCSQGIAPAQAQQWEVIEDGCGRRVLWGDPRWEVVDTRRDIKFGEPRWGLENTWGYFRYTFRAGNGFALLYSSEDGDFNTVYILVRRPGKDRDLIVRSVGYKDCPRPLQRIVEAADAASVDTIVERLLKAVEQSAGKLVVGKSPIEISSWGAIKRYSEFPNHGQRNTSTDGLD